MKIFNLIKNIISNKIFFIIFFGTLSLLSIGLAVNSLKWFYGIDNQFLLYMAFLIDKFSLLPYRDFFANQFPLTFLIYFIIAKIFGYSHLGLRIADLLFLFTFLTFSFILIKKISIRTAWSSIITFSLIYFIGGNNYSFERDFILLLPIIISILFSYSYPKRFINLKSFVLGFCGAMSALIKPNAIIVFPILLIFHILYNSEENTKILKRLLKPLIYVVLGLMVPVLLTILYLWVTNSFNSFWEIQTNFNVIYRNSKMYIVSDPSLPINNIILNSMLKLERFRPFVFPAAIGFYISVFKSNLDRKQKLLIWQIGFLSIFFIVYVVIAGKFLFYHWIPFAYLIIILSSTCFVKPNPAIKYSFLLELIALIAIFSIITIQITRPQNIQYYRNELMGNSTGNDNLYPLYPDILKSAEYLKTNLKPGDKVLPLDDIGTAIHSMLLAKAEIATYYPFEALFLYAEKEFPKSTYLQLVHTDYMNRFKSAKPRFVIDFSGAQHYLDLQQILDSEYNAIKLEHGIIYERKPGV